MPVEYEVDAHGCWVVTTHRAKGHKSPARRVNGRLVYLHREAFEAAFGPVPEGRVVRQMCGQCLCINPRHLAAVTFADVAADRAARGDQHAIQVHLNTESWSTGGTLSLSPVLPGRRGFGCAPWTTSLRSAGCTATA